MNLSNREEFINRLRQVNQPHPEAQHAQQQAMQMEMVQKQATIDNIQAQTAEIVSRVQQNAVETELLPYDTVAKLPNESDKEFERRTKLAELLLKERALETKEDIVEMQMRK